MKVTLYSTVTVRCDGCGTPSPKLDVARISDDGKVAPIADVVRPAVEARGWRVADGAALCAACQA